MAGLIRVRTQGMLGLDERAPAVSAMALIWGYDTRLATFLSWYLLISLHTRNPIILHDGDTVLRLLF